MLERFDPRRSQFPIKRIRDDITQMFNRFFDEPFFQSQSTSTFVPVINIREEAEKYTVEAELPGMDINDIDIEVRGNVLTIRGERKYEQKKEGEHVHMIESSYGSFQRSFTLPDHINIDEITADSRNGILYIHIPKDETKRTRKININTNPEH